MSKSAELFIFDTWYFHSYRCFSPNIYISIYISNIWVVTLHLPSNCIKLRYILQLLFRFVDQKCWGSKFLGSTNFGGQHILGFNKFSGVQIFWETQIFEVQKCLGVNIFGGSIHFLGATFFGGPTFLWGNIFHRSKFVGGQHFLGSKQFVGSNNSGVLIF